MDLRTYIRKPHAIIAALGLVGIVAIGALRLHQLSGSRTNVSVGNHDSYAQTLRPSGANSFVDVTEKSSDVMIVRVHEMLHVEKYAPDGLLRTVYSADVLHTIKGDATGVIEFDVSGGVLGAIWEEWDGARFVAAGNGKPPASLLSRELVDGRVYVISANYDSQRQRYSAASGDSGMVTVPSSEAANDAKAVRSALALQQVRDAVQKLKQ